MPKLNLVDSFITKIICIRDKYIYIHKQLISSVISNRNKKMIDALLTVSVYTQRTNVYIAYEYRDANEPFILLRVVIMMIMVMVKIVIRLV